MEAAIISHTIGDMLSRRPRLGEFHRPTRGPARRQRLEEIHAQLGPGNAAAVVETVRQKFLERVAMSATASRAATAEQKE